MQKLRAAKQIAYFVLVAYLFIAVFGLAGQASFQFAPCKAAAQANRLSDITAKEHFQKGNTFYESGRFEDAAHEFEKAYQISHRPQLLYNVYLAYRDLNQLELSADALRRYLDSDVNDPRREQLEARLRAIEKTLRDQELEHTARGASTESSADESKGTSGSNANITQAQTQTATPAGSETSPVDTFERSGRSFTVPAIASFAVAGAGVVTTIIFGTLAITKKSSLEKQCAPNCTDSQVAPVRSFRVIADVGLGVAVLGAAVGGVLWYFSGGSKEAQTSPRAALPKTTAKAGYFDFSWRF